MNPFIQDGKRQSVLMAALAGLLANVQPGEIVPVRGQQRRRARHQATPAEKQAKSRREKAEKKQRKMAAKSRRINREWAKRR